MSCAEFERRQLQVAVTHVTQLPYHEFGQRIRCTLLTWLCRELLKVHGGTDQWDGFPTKEPINALAKFEAIKEGIDYKWIHFVVYLLFYHLYSNPFEIYLTIMI